MHDLFKSVQEQWLDCLLPAMAAMVDEHSQDETQCVVTGEYVHMHVYSVPIL